MRKHFQYLQDFVIEFLSDFRFSADENNSSYSQIAVIRFSDSAELLINFTDATTLNQFEDLVRSKVSYKRNRRGNTNITEY